MSPTRHRLPMRFSRPIRRLRSHAFILKTVLRLICVASNTQNGIVGLVGHGLPPLGSCVPPNASEAVSTCSMTRLRANRVMPQEKLRVGRCPIAAAK